MYRIQLLPGAARALERTPIATRRRLAHAIDELASNPRPHGSQKLRGADDIWRLRVGDYRILYQVQDDLLLILVIKIGHRREVYR